MIGFTLVCDNEHRFDGWFRSSDDFEDQQKREQIDCPVCGSAKICKSLMAPQISTARTRETTREKINLATTEAARREVIGEMRELRDKMLDGAEDVGRNIAEEARKIHYGESDKKRIYGTASREEVESLVDEGVPVAPIPVLPEDVN